MGMALSTPEDRKSKSVVKPATAEPVGDNNYLHPNTNPNLEHRRRRALIARLKKFGKKPKLGIVPGSNNDGGAAYFQPTRSTNTGADSNLSSSPRRTFRGNVVPEMPRMPTFKRVLSEKREKLRPYEIPHHERRKVSSDLRRSPRASSRSLPAQAQSVRSISSSFAGGDQTPTRASRDALADAEAMTEPELVESSVALALLQDDGVGSKDSAPELVARSDTVMTGSTTDLERRASPAPTSVPLVSREVEEELDWRWILNLSMHFRDESNREKFFVTYAQEFNLRRRITISCDYRNAKEGSLEKELSTLRYQRDKSAKIYEAIRDSLQDIMFYDTITNLKLQTADGRLHVHVTEDLNEIIPYPPVMAIAHLKCAKFPERDLVFDSHLSGFVYKVKINNEIFIKKEIPGPDTVDEFLYEINALHALADSENVIRFGGCVLDDQRQKVKGLLISYASRGALVDIIYNECGRLPWTLREKWAKQIVSGLAEIHEAGYVQGDFTLRNIVIDEYNDAKIIDINQRGCPVGWEPPEITAMIEGLQRIGMYIGVKSDLFQLGMVLWGLSHEIDEPELSQYRPFTMDQAPDDVPDWFRDIVGACLCDKPQGRPSAKDLLALFPERIDDPPVIIEKSDAAGAPEEEQGFPSSAAPSVGERTDAPPPRRSDLDHEPKKQATWQLNGQALRKLQTTLPTAPSEYRDSEGNVVVVDVSPSTSTKSVRAKIRTHVTSISSLTRPASVGGGVVLPASRTSSPDEEAGTISQYSQSGVFIRDIPERINTVSPGETEIVDHNITPIAEKYSHNFDIREIHSQEQPCSEMKRVSNGDEETPVFQTPAESRASSRTETGNEKGY